MPNTTDQWRFQSTSNRQGSKSGELKWPDGRAGEGRPSTTAHRANILWGKGGSIPVCGGLYEERLKFGVAREQARKDVPWKIDTICSTSSNFTWPGKDT